MNSEGMGAGNVWFSAPLFFKNFSKFFGGGEVFTS